MKIMNFIEMEIDDRKRNINNQIEGAEPGMMIREFTMNALEALKVPKEKIREIEIYGSKTTDIMTGEPLIGRKLTIRNTGLGMSKVQLDKMTKLSYSGAHKNNKKNRGEGAKISSLKYNSLGVRFRSCYNGEVYESAICIVKDKLGDNFAVQVMKETEDDMLPAWVPNFTDEEWNNINLDHDWTEVQACGNTSEQDTFADPYGTGNEHAAAITEEIFTRFFRFKADGNLPTVLKFNSVDIKRRSEDSERWADTTKMRLIGDLLDGKVFKKHIHSYNTVELENGIILHYLHAKLNGNHHPFRDYSLGPNSSMIGLVWDNEMFDVKYGNTWKSDAFNYGLVGMGAEVSVLVEIPERMAKDDRYRKHIKYTSYDGMKHPREDETITTRDFAAEIIDNMPKSIKDAVRAKFQVRINDKKVQSILDDINKRVKEARSNHIHVKPGEGTLKYGAARTEAIHEYPNNKPNNPKSTEQTLRSSGARSAMIGTDFDKKMRRQQDAPKYELLSNTDDNPELVDKIAIYNETENKFYINLNHPVINRQTDFLSAKYQARFPDHYLEFRALVNERVLDKIIVVIGSYIVHAFWNSRRPPNWKIATVELMCTPENLSIVVESHFLTGGEVMNSFEQSHKVKEILGRANKNKQVIGKAKPKATPDIIDVGRDIIV